MVKNIKHGFFLIVGLIAACTTVKINTSPTANSPKKPNIILILADDLGYNDVGYINKNTYYLTPTIDALAKQSCRFSNFYAMPTCSPSRASLMTGVYPSRHGIYAVDAFAGTPNPMRKILGGQSKKQLDKETFTMPVLFKNAGYKTALIGKWHLGDNPLTYKNQPIFDEIIGRSLPNEGHPESHFPPYESVNFDKKDDAPDYLTDRLTYEACHFIEKNKSQPFFLYLAHYAPHVPLHARKEDTALFTNRKPWLLQNRPAYAAMIYSVDRSVKKVLEQLKTDGLLDNTIIIFMSDNGGQIMSTDNTPLTGQKGEITEGGIKVPAFVWYQGVKSIDNQSIVSIVDILPTLADLTHLPIPSDVIIDGKNLTPLLKGGKGQADRAIFFHNPAYTGNGKSNGLVWQTPASVMRKGKWKLVQSLEDETVLLFDMEQDGQEQNNCALKNPKVTAALLTELKTWQEQTGALIPDKINPDYKPETRAWISRKNTRLPNDNTNIRVQ